MEHNEQPLFIFDLDGVIINTNINIRGSAKYKESFEIVTELTGNTDLESFEEFYFKFNEKAVDMSLEEASLFFAIMLNGFYDTKIDPAKFVEYRAKKRSESYEKYVGFIGDEIKNNEQWLAQLPEGIRGRMYIATTCPRRDYELLNKNPNVLISGRTIDDFFGWRVLTREDVTHLKPNPEIYNELLKIEKPLPNFKGYCGIAFEDSLSGIKAARDAKFNNANLFVVGVESTLSSQQLRNFGADYTTPALYVIDVDDLIEKSGF